MSGLRKSDTQPVQVFVRVRPFIEHEPLTNCVEIPTSKDISIKVSYHKKFTFDEVLGPRSDQISIYNVIKSYISDVISGYNCTVMTYGQASSGKTYTMIGILPKNSTSIGSLPNIHVGNNIEAEIDVTESGLIPRVLSDLFVELDQLEEKYTVSCTYFELFNEELRDLFSVSDDRQNVRIYDDRHKKGAVIVQGLEEVRVKSKLEVFKLLRKGQHKRQEAARLRTDKSGFSHTIFTVFVRTQEKMTDGEESIKLGKLCFVDLAGIEPVQKSSGVERRARDIGNVGQSLLTLGRVVKSLSEKNSHVPFRESKLTRILQDSLGGKTKTSIIATISPSLASVDETLNTLEFAQLARTIINKPEVNKKILHTALMAYYIDEVTRLRKDLEATRTGSGICLDADNYDTLLSELQLLKDEVVRHKLNIRVLEKETNEKSRKIQTMNQNVQDACRDVHSYASDSIKTLTEFKENITLLNVDRTKAYDEAKHIVSKTIDYKVNNKNVLEKHFKKLPRHAEAFNQVLNTSSTEFNRSLARFQNGYNLISDRLIKSSVENEQENKTNNVMSEFTNVISNMESTLTDVSGLENVLKELTNSNVQMCALQDTVENLKQKWKQNINSKMETCNEHLMKTKEQHLTAISDIRVVQNNFKANLAKVNQQFVTNAHNSINSLQGANDLISELMARKNTCNEFLTNYNTEATTQNKLLQKKLSAFSQAVDIGSEEFITKTSDVYRKQQLSLCKTLEDVHESMMKEDAQVEAFVTMSKDCRLHSEQHNINTVEEIHQLQSLINCTDTNISEVKHAGDTPIRIHYKFPPGFKDLTPKETVLSRFREKLDGIGDARDTENTEESSVSDSTPKRAMSYDNVENLS